MNKDYTSPADGELLLSRSNNFVYSGDHRLDLGRGEQQDVKKGDVISVVCTETRSDDDGGRIYGFAANAEYDKGSQTLADIEENYYYKAVVNSGESYLYKDGAWTDWKDTSREIADEKSDDKDTMVVDNFSIKLFGTEESSATDSTTTDPSKTVVTVKAPGKPSIGTVVTASKKTEKVSWKKVSGATSYKFSYRKAGASKWTTKTTKKTSYTLKTLKARGLYEVRVAAVKTASGKSAAGKYSKISYRYINGSGHKVTAQKKAIKVTWKKDTNATGYKIKYSANKNMKNVKTITVKGGKKSSFTIKKLTKGKRYYVEVRPYKTKGGHSYIGSSLRKSAKVK